MGRLGPTPHNNKPKKLTQLKQTQKVNTKHWPQQQDQ